MAERALFFNARPDAQSPTGYDRNYDADDISQFFSALISTGVVKGLDGLKVSAGGGMEVRVNAGKAVINGKPYTNDNYKAFTVPTAPTVTTARKDAIVLRFDNSVNAREIAAVYRQGDASGATPTITRNNTVYELMLATITVGQNVTAITDNNITDLRGDDKTVITLSDGTQSVGYCPFVTMTKGYEDYYDAMIQRFKDFTTVAAQTTTVTTGLSSTFYNPATDLISVYINGDLTDPDDYTISASGSYVTLTFDYAITAGQTVGIELTKAYDGEGLPNVLQDYLNLKAQVAALKGGDDVYVCNGVTDNVGISQIADTFLRGSTTDGAQKCIRVTGNFGITAPNSGNGSQTTPFHVCDLDIEIATNRKIIFDFTNCTKISYASASNYAVMFAGKNVHIVGGSFEMSGTNQNKIFDSAGGDVTAENSRFVVTGANLSMVANTGTFTNCYSYVVATSGIGNAYRVVGDGILRLNGGEHYAYSVSGQPNAVVQMAYGSGGLSVAIINGASFPTKEKSGYIQTNYILKGGEGFVSSFGAISTLATDATATEIFGTIAQSKAKM